MTWDPQVRAFLDDLAAQNPPPPSSLTPEQARAAMRLDTAALGDPEPVARIEDLVLPGPGGEIPVRVYDSGETDPAPALVFFHGGGWVLGDLETHHNLCCTLANAAGCTVVSVDYRLAPEHKYPAAAEDAHAAVQWVIAEADSLGVDPRRVAVGGDSAGGNLAAVAALMARDRHAPQPAFQLLLYPVTDYRFDTPSYRDNAEGYLLTRADMQWFWGQYLNGPEDGAGAYASPLQADDLSGLPPALVVTAEYDPLRDEGEAYAGRLSDAGSTARLWRYGGLIHGFARRTDLFDRARVALGDITETLKSRMRITSV